MQPLSGDMTKQPSPRANKELEESARYQQDSPVLLTVGWDVIHLFQLTLKEIQAEISKT